MAPWTGTSGGPTEVPDPNIRGSSRQSGKTAAPWTGASWDEGEQPRTGASKTEQQGGANNKDDQINFGIQGTTPRNRPSGGRRQEGKLTRTGSIGESQEGEANDVPIPGQDRARWQEHQELNNDNIK